MLADPQSLTVNAIAVSLPRISVEADDTVYRNLDGTLEFKVSHTESASRKRHQVRVDFNKIAADPLTAENQKITGSVYIVIDEPVVGFTDAELGHYVAALAGWLTTANVAAVTAGQS